MMNFSLQYRTSAYCDLIAVEAVQRPGHLFYNPVNLVNPVQKIPPVRSSPFPCLTPSVLTMERIPSAPSSWMSATDANWEPLLSTTPAGKEGILLDPRDHNLARQYPGDYLEGLEQSVRTALAQAALDPAFSRSGVIGIGVDTTGSSPLPVDAQNIPLAFHPAMARPPRRPMLALEGSHQLPRSSAHHGAGRGDAPAITSRSAATLTPPSGSGAKSGIASRWRRRFLMPRTAGSRLADFIPSVLAGVTDPLRDSSAAFAAPATRRCIATNGTGFRTRNFSPPLDPKLAALARSALHTRLRCRALPLELCARNGRRSSACPAGIPIAIGEMDVHYGAIGSGIEEGVLVKVIGTSTCDCAVVGGRRRWPTSRASAASSKGAILPGLLWH